MENETLKSIENDLAELVNKIMDTKAKYKNASVLNILSKQKEINEESKLLAIYGYELEKLILKKVIVENGQNMIAQDFDKSAIFPKHMKGIIDENTEIIQSNCKIFGKSIDKVFNEVRDNYHQYLNFLAEDAAGPKNFVNQANSYYQ
jgi:hypothetical protein